MTHLDIMKKAKESVTSAMKSRFRGLVSPRKLNLKVLKNAFKTKNLGNFDANYRLPQSAEVKSKNLENICIPEKKPQLNVRSRRSLIN